MKNITNIDDAIKHAYDTAKTLKCSECKNWHIQIAKWLEELKSLRDYDDKYVKVKDKFSIDEAIEHAYDVARESIDSENRRAHKQLGDWLTELKRLRNKHEEKLNIVKENSNRIEYII